MRIGLGYSYRNCVKEIPRGLDPVAKHFYKVYAVDGRYINYEDGKPDWSTDGSTELLKKRYPNVQIEQVKPMFQTDKRQICFDRAGEDKCDYLIVWDSDDIVIPKYSDWNKLFKNIERYSKKFPDYRVFKMKSWIPTIKEWSRAYNMVKENVWNPYVRIHKDPGTMRYCLYCHWWWCSKDYTDEDLILQKGGLFIADHTIEGVRITTDSALRGEVQLMHRDSWAWNNDCEEKRRVWMLSSRLHYTPDELEKTGYLDVDGYWRYDGDGRPTSKICNEDGSPPNLVPKLRKSPM